MKRRTRTRLTLFVFTVIFGTGVTRNRAQPSLPQRPADQSNSDATNKNVCTVAGTVVSAATGEPLKKARVFLSPQTSDDSQHPQVSISDAAGHFNFDGVIPGRYDLHVERTGYVTQRYGQDQPDKPGAILTLSAGHNMTDLLFRLQNAGVITGHVVDEDGEPAQGVEVELLRRTYTPQGARTRMYGVERRNDLGKHRIYGLSPGRYYLVATWNLQRYEFGRAKVTPASREEAAMGYLPTYYAGTTDAGRASVIQVAAGTEAAGIDFQLSRSRTYSVRGHVSKVAGDAELSGVMLNLTPRASDLPGKGTFGRDVDAKTGAFEIKGVSPGAYLLRAVWRDNGQMHESSQPVDVTNGDVDDVGVVLGPGAKLTGHLDIEGQLPTNTGLEVYLSSPQLSFSPARGGTVNADGSFTLADLSDGTFMIHVVSGCRTCYVKSATANGQDVLLKGLQISAGASPGALDIVYSSLAGSVSGVVKRDDDLPAAGALVVLVPNVPFRETYDRYKRSTTDQFGAFSIEGVPPGNYKVFAWEKMDGAEYEDPEFLKGYENQGESLEMEESGKQTMQLKLLAAPATAAANQ